jgi:hypothetical protein
MPRRAGSVGGIRTRDLRVMGANMRIDYPAVAEATGARAGRRRVSRWQSSGKPRRGRGQSGGRSVDPVTASVMPSSSAARSTLRSNEATEPLVCFAVARQ